MASRKKPVASKQLATLDHTESLDAKSMELALLGGDLSGLTAPQRLSYYNELCKSLALNPLTKPFVFIKNKAGAIVMYAAKDCTEQIRRRDNISIKITKREIIEGIYTVTAEATNKEGRCDESIGAVCLEFVKGEAKADAMMKAETKAKRRVTLSIGGLGAFDDDGSYDAPVNYDVTSEPKTPEAMQAAVVSVNEQQLIQDKERAEKLGIDPSLMEDMEVTKTPINPPAKIIEAELVPEKENKITVANMQYDYRDVVCHIGTASGPCLGKTVGDCVRKLENDIKSPEVWKWLVKTINKSANPTGKDKVLIEALTKAIEVHETGSKSTGTGPIPASKPEKVTPQPNEQPELVKVTDWRTEIIDIEVPVIKGKAFGELNDKWLNAIQSNILDDPEKSKLATPRFKAVYALARDGAGLDCSLADIQETIKTYFDNLLLTEGQAIAYLQKLEVVPADLDTLPGVDPTIKDIDETLLRYIYRNWPDTREALKSELEPKAKPSTKRAKKK